MPFSNALRIEREQRVFHMGLSLWETKNAVLSGLKGNKEFFTWGYLYEKLRMRLSYDLMKDPIKEKKLLKQIRVIKQ